MADIMNIFKGIDTGGVCVYTRDKENECMNKNLHRNSPSCLEFLSHTHIYPCRQTLLGGLTVPDIWISSYLLHGAVPHHT